VDEKAAVFDHLRLLALPELDQVGKVSQGTNTLAYLATSSVTNLESFITLNTKVNYFQHYFFVIDKDAK
jgi:hypothetical protein